MTMKNIDIINHLNAMQVQIDTAKAWDSARKLVIDHLTQYHGLTDPYQWAFKTIELLKELQTLKDLKDLKEMNPYNK